MDLKTLYREIVNEHNLHPGHKGDLPAPTHIRQGVNPTCGDDIHLQLAIDGEGVITAASFNGSGCAISQASAARSKPKSRPPQPLNRLINFKIPPQIS